MRGKGNGKSKTIYKGRGREGDNGIDEPGGGDEDFVNIVFFRWDVIGASRNGICSIFGTRDVFNCEVESTEPF